MKIALFFRSYGPYHLARLAALRKLHDVHAIEFSSVDPDYRWEAEARKRAEKVVSINNCQSHLFLELDRYHPDAVAVPGWSESLALRALIHCQRRRFPIVMMSESRAEDARRFVIREALKRRVLRFCGGALVGGQPQAAYLERLGFDPQRIFTGYDTVDNQHFAFGSDFARQQAKEIRQALSLPMRFFLCCARLVQKKNLLMLIEAFRNYKRLLGSLAFDLVIAGDGALRPVIQAYIASCHLEESVHLVGHKSYHEMPALYGLAEAFVLPSLTDQWGLVVNEAMAAGLPVLVSRGAGCAADLVQEGKNGFTFDPHSPQELASLLYRLSVTNNLNQLGDNSRAIIANWDLSHFLSGCTKAVETAVANPRANPDQFSRALTIGLSLR